MTGGEEQGEDATEAVPEHGGAVGTRLRADRGEGKRKVLVAIGLERVGGVHRVGHELGREVARLQRQVAKPDHDPSLWFLVRTGEEVVAATRNDPERSGGGWIGALGVRPAWRGRGLAKALLLHSFHEFHRRGQRRVGLGVDSQNASGATRLYESIGMVVDSEQVVWEKDVA